jgi:hypothetical protein
MDEKVLERLSLLLVGLWALAAMAIHFWREPIVLTPDSASFMRAAEHILGGNPVDNARTPGYPALLAIVQNDPRAATMVQGFLFVAAAIGVAFLGQRASGRWWVGLVTGAAFAISWAPVHYARTIGSEALSIPAFVALACVVVTFEGRRVLLGSVLVALLVFTRLEFIALPALLVALVWLGRPRRRTLYWALGAAAATYTALVLYAVANGVTNDYYGLSVVSRINRLGKVMEYRMQHRAPARFDDVTVRLDAYLGQPAPYYGPYVFAAGMPELRADNWRLAGEYGLATIEAAPIEYAVETAREVSRRKWFVAIAVCWLAAWATLGGARTRVLGLLSLLALYDILMTSLGGYESFDRLQAPAYPLCLTIAAVSAFFVIDCVRRVVGMSGVRRRHAVLDDRREERHRCGTAPDES